MIRIDAVIARFPALDERQIADWVARGWVHAEGESRSEWTFADIDIARLHLIRDLHVDLAVDEDALPLVLSLLDQLYDLRRTLRTVLEVVHEAPEEVRRRVLGALAPQD